MRPADKPTPPPVCCFSDLADLAEAVGARACYAIDEYRPDCPNFSLGDIARLRVAVAKMLARVDGLLEAFT